MRPTTLLLPEKVPLCQLRDAGMDPSTQRTPSSLQQADEGNEQQVIWFFGSLGHLAELQIPETSIFRSQG
jgi:hypothetical protein